MSYEETFLLLVHWLMHIIYNLLFMLLVNDYDDNIVQFGIWSWKTVLIPQLSTLQPRLETYKYSGKMIKSLYHSNLGRVTQKGP